MCVCVCVCVFVCGVRENRVNQEPESTKIKRTGNKNKKTNTLVTAETRRLLIDDSSAVLNRGTELRQSDLFSPHLTIPNIFIFFYLVISFILFSMSICIYLLFIYILFIYFYTSEGWGSVCVRGGGALKIGTHFISRFLLFCSQIVHIHNHLDL